MAGNISPTRGETKTHSSAAGNGNNAHNYGEINMVDIRTENEELRRKNALLVDHLRKYLSLGAHLYYTTIDEGADWARKTRELLDSLGGEGVDENRT